MAKGDQGGQRRANQTRQDDDEAAAAEPSAEAIERRETLSDDVDAILEEIDEVLEENAEEFVSSYVQKGGQ